MIALTVPLKIWISIEGLYTHAYKTPDQGVYTRSGDAVKCLNKNAIFTIAPCIHYSMTKHGQAISMLEIPSFCKAFHSLPE